MSKNNELWYENFVVYMEDRNIVRFEATKGTNVYDAVTGIIKFLNINKVDGEFPLIFNDQELKISRLSKRKEVVDEYFSRGNLQL